MDERERLEQLIDEAVALLAALERRAQPSSVEAR
jgi:hypothetical protein